MAAAADLPVRFTTPGEIAAAVPHLCGFVPTESIVVVSLRGPRHRIGLTLRLDLPADEPFLDAEVATMMAGRLAHDGAASALIVVFTEAAGDRPRAGLARAVETALAAKGIDVMEGLLVRAGRWSSYTCDRETCCPRDGTPILTTRTVETFAAVAAYDGRVVLRDRDELVASLAPPQLLAARSAEQALDAAMTDWLADADERGADVVVRDSVAGVRAALDAATEVSELRAVQLVVGLQSLEVRDRVAVLALDRAEEVLALLLALARRSVAPYDVPVCTLIAVAAWVRGDGALANVALDRALAGDPRCSLARLLQHGLDGQLPPSAVRAWLRETRKSLRSPRRRRAA
jgi:hypothetical protein